MLMWQLGCALLCILWFYYLWRQHRFYLLALKIPSVVGYPIIGAAYKIVNMANLLPTMGNYLNKYGPMILTWLGPIPAIVLTEPQLIQDVLTSPHCVNKSIVYKVFEDGFGKGIFTLSDPQWSEHRKLVKPAFGHKMILSFVSIFNNESASFLSAMETLVDSGEKDLKHLLQGFTLNVATQTTMGTKVKDTDNIENNKLLQNYHSILTFFSEVIFSPWLNSKIVRQVVGKEKGYLKAKSGIREFIKMLIDKKLAKDSQDSHLSLKKNTYLNIEIDLLKRGKFSRKDVEDDSSLIIFGAFEATATVLHSILMILSMFPIYQEKAFEEILSLFPNSGDFKVSYEDTQKMDYLDLIINEAMRFIPPAPMIGRETSQDVMLSNGVLLPKGLQICIDIFHLHRNEKIWGNDAKTFNPDHFLPNNVKDRHPYSYIPFSKGKRMCMGWKFALVLLKVTLAKLLRNYKFLTFFKAEDLVFVYDITVNFKTKPLLKLQRRNS